MNDPEVVFVLINKNGDEIALRRDRLALGTRGGRGMCVSKKGPWKPKPGVFMHRLPGSDPCVCGSTSEAHLCYGRQEGNPPVEVETSHVNENADPCERCGSTVVVNDRCGRCGAR